MAHYFFSIGVDSSLAMNKEEYYFIYKDTEFSYKPGYKKGDTDNFTGKFKTSFSEDEAYKLMTEFLSAHAFSTDAQIIPQPGLRSGPLSCSIKDFKGGCGQSRSIPAYERMDEFYYIAPIDTPDQATLASLYRQARSTNDNVYFSLLFYWHILVYPSQDDVDGVSYFDKITGNLPGEIDYVQEEIKRVKRNPVFEYIQSGVRHSIAHIVRDGNYDAKNIELDLLSEERHLNDIVNILHTVSRHKLELDYGLKEACPLEIFRYFDPT
jgi:hypothetical protein